MNIRELKGIHKIGSLLLLAGAFGISSLSAHCDAWDGPVVMEAQEAFRAEDVTPTLKWIMPVHEAELRSVFDKALAASRAGEAAAEVAELWFLETLVRIHREGEGAPYAGLKPAGQIDTAVQLADEALEKGAADALADRISDAVRHQILARFEEANKRRASAGETVREGRHFVEAYVDYVHFVEEIHHLLQHGGHSH